MRNGQWAMGNGQWKDCYAFAADLQNEKGVYFYVRKIRHVLLVTDH